MKTSETSNFWLKPKNLGYSRKVMIPYRLIITQPSRDSKKVSPRVPGMRTRPVELCSPDEGILEPNRVAAMKRQRAGFKSVVVIRRQGDKYQRYELDLAAVIDGKKDSAFVLDSYDIVSIPQRVW